MSVKHVEIAICTWNRARLLEQTLDSIAQMSVPHQVKLSILVVDNRSTDSTPQVLARLSEAEFFQQHKLIALKELRQGHTFARNRAIEATQGDLILWTDDDVIVSKHWLERYVSAANQSPTISFFGSVIRPEFESGRPAWMEGQWETIRGCFAGRDLGDQPLSFDEKTLPYGANFAIRTTVQKQHPFNSDLGRRGDEVVGEDEIEMLWRVVRDGHEGHWVPDAEVEHIVPKERATEKYVYDYFVGQGKSLVHRGKVADQDAGQLAKQSRWNYWCYKIKRRFAPTEVWMGHMLQSALDKGKAKALSNRQNLDQSPAANVG